MFEHDGNDRREIAIYLVAALVAEIDEIVSDAVRVCVKLFKRPRFIFKVNGNLVRMLAHIFAEHTWNGRVAGTQLIEEYFRLNQTNQRPVELTQNALFIARRLMPCKRPGSDTLADISADHGAIWHIAYQQPIAESGINVGDRASVASHESDPLRSRQRCRRAAVRILVAIGHVFKSIAGWKSKCAAQLISEVTVVVTHCRLSCN